MSVEACGTRSVENAPKFGSVRGSWGARRAILAAYLVGRRALIEGKAGQVEEFCRAFDGENPEWTWLNHGDKSYLIPPGCYGEGFAVLGRAQSMPEDLPGESTPWEVDERHLSVPVSRYGIAMFRMAESRGKIDVGEIPGLMRLAAAYAALNGTGVIGAPEAAEAVQTYVPVAIGQLRPTYMADDGQNACRIEMVLCIARNRAVVVGDTVCHKRKAPEAGR